MLLGRRKPGDPRRKGDAWLVSYGDLVTTLLCFFIVLSTLAKDQTGFQLKAGLESFRSYLHPSRASGLTGHSTKVVPLPAETPHYALASAENATPEEQPRPDEPRRIIDGEEEQLQQFLEEMDRLFQVEKTPETRASATVDFHERLGKTSPCLNSHHLAVVRQVLPLLRRPDYQVTVTVWATMPVESAWLRASNQARLVATELADLAQLDPKARERILAVGQPWRYPEFERPVFSLTVSKLEKAPHLP